MVFIVSFVSLIGSIYYSNVVGLVPCDLCWYQRILMYPLLFLSTTSIIFSTKLSKRFIAALTVPGMFLALYHYLLQKFGLGAQFVTCSNGVSCQTIDVEFFGFITLPLLSFVAFLTINVVLLSATRIRGLDTLIPAKIRNKISQEKKSPEAN